MKKNKGNILITRKLSTDSPLWQLESKGYRIIDHSFLHIEAIEIDHIPQADVYFYFSKNAVIHFMNAAKHLGVDLSNAQHATIGKGTAKCLNIKYGIEPNLVGIGTPTQVAESLKEKYNDHKVCFVRAKQSTQSVQRLWSTPHTEAIVYDTLPNMIDIDDEIQHIIATSPKNIEYALKAIDTNHLQQIICIGNTTSAAANRFIKTQIIISKESTEQSILDAFNEITQL